MVVSTNLSQKEMRRRKRSRRQIISRLFWIALAALVLAGLGYALWQLARPKLGVAVAKMGSPHIQVQDQHEPYNSDPPTSGPHLAQPAEAGFYDEALSDEQLVHNLEHGYVVIWYNCSGIEETACAAFKIQIRNLMDRAGSRKLIAVPRSSLPGAIAATTWGRLYQPATFDPDDLLTFIKQFRYKAPEANAP